MRVEEAINRKIEKSCVGSRRLGADDASYSKVGPDMVSDLSQTA